MTQDLTRDELKVVEVQWGLDYPLGIRIRLGGQFMEGLLAALVEVLEAGQLDLAAWALGWARVMPLVTLLPAFGGRLLPPVARAVLALALAFTLAPTIHPVAVIGNSWPLQLLNEALIGLPVALGASSLLWAASMAGGLIDELRGAGELSNVSMLEPSNPALGALFGLFAALGFLSLGGVSRTVEHLMAPAPGEQWLLRAVSDLAGSVGIALSLAAPILGLVIIVEVASSLIARAASPAHIRVLLGPLRALAVLVGLSWSLDAMFRWLLDRLS